MNWKKILKNLRQQGSPKTLREQGSPKDRVVVNNGKPVKDLTPEEELARIDRNLEGRNLR